MPIYFRIPIALDLLCLALQQLLPITSVILPLGGTHIAQFGGLMCVGVVAFELRNRPKRRPKRDTKASKDAAAKPRK